MLVDALPSGAVREVILTPGEMLYVPPLVRHARSLSRCVLALAALRAAPPTTYVRTNCVGTHPCSLPSPAARPPPTSCVVGARACAI